LEKTWKKEMMVKLPGRCVLTVLVVRALQGWVSATLGFIQKNPKVEGEIFARLGLQSPLILYWCAHAGNQVLETLDCSREIINVVLEQLKEFFITSGHNGTSEYAAMEVQF
jgi:hypothetical protein